MANKQISDLSNGTIKNDNDVFIMDTYEGTTVKIPYSVLKQAIAKAITTVSSTLTLAVANWDATTKQQTVVFTHDINKRNVIDITIGEITTWGECGVRAISETATGITFECDTVPETVLTFKVTSTEVG